ncbi:MAG: PAS domain-containing sensor histidine kinase [Candidatus Methanoperedens sp.]
MSGDRNVKPGFAGFGELIGISIGLAAIVWVLDSILDSIIFHEGTLIGQLLSPAAHEIGIRVLFGFILIIFGAYTQLNMDRRKQAEEALKGAIVKAEEEKNKSEAIIASLGDGIIIQDTDYKILYQNQIQNEIYGNRVGEYCYKAYEGKDTICEDCPIEASFSDGKIHKTERTVPTDKGILYTELTGSLLRDSTGKIIGGVKVVRDITGLKRVEETLRESEEKYRALFEATPVGIGIADLEGKVLDGNVNMLEMTGFTLEEIKSVDVGATYVDQDERKLLLKTLQETGRVRDLEVRLKRKDGTIYYALLNVDLLELGGHKVVLTTARDITEPKKAEKEKDRLLKAIDNSNDGIIIADEKDRYIYLNEAYANIYGYPEEELIGETWRKITPPELIAPTELELDRTVHNKNGGLLSGEFPAVRKDGINIPLEVRGTGLWDEKGNYQGHICIVRDITERKKVEEKLKLLSEAVDEALDGIIITNLNGFIIYSNKAVEDIYGFSHDELKGKQVSELNADPEFTKKVILPDLITKVRWVGELKAKKKEGQEFPIWLTASQVKNRSGEPIALVGVIRDITERKHIEEVLLEKEERYRSLFEDSPISLWEEDSSGIKKYIDALKNKGIENLRTYFDRHPKEVALCASMVKVLDVNKASITLFKAKSKSDLIDGLENIFTDRSYETFKKELIAISEGKTQFESEDIVKTLTGDKIHISMRWVLTPGNEETYSKRLVSIVDITERKRAEEEIKKYTRELEESNRMKELFADIMHHDLLNPLTTANGFIELLKEDETISRKKAYLETIERSLVKGMELIDSAMKYSNFESLESIELEELDLNKVIEGVIEDLTPLADNAGMEIINRMNLNTPVRANKIIEEVFSNLISNAIKYASSGKRIILESENMGENLQVRVIDFGEGIKESDKTMIFERFRRGGKIGVKGSGLGLAIAGKIMELHNGRIWVEDNPEGGAVFIVEIPGI